MRRRTLLSPRGWWRAQGKLRFPLLGPRAGRLKGGSKTCAAAMPRNALAVCFGFRTGLALCKRSCNRDCQPVGRRRRRLQQRVRGCLQQSRWGRHVLEFAGSRLSNAEASIGRRRQRCLCRRSHRRAKTRTAIIWLLLSVIAFQQTS